MDYWNNYKPRVDKKWLYAIAGLVWSGIGLLLSNYAYKWLKPLPAATALPPALVGLTLALVIYYFGFSTLVDNNIQRICNLPGAKIFILAFQRWSSYPLVVVMISMGIYLRVYSPVPKPILAIIYIGMGASLFFASLHYYKYFWYFQEGRVPATCGTAD